MCYAAMMFMLFPLRCSGTLQADAHRGFIIDSVSLLILLLNTGTTAVED